MTPYAYLLQKRIAIARDMLISGAEISEVAALCRFYDQSHFSRYFRKVYGTPPGEFIKMIK